MRTVTPHQPAYRGASRLCGTPRLVVQAMAMLMVYGFAGCHLHDHDHPHGHGHGEEHGHGEKHGHGEEHGDREAHGDEHGHGHGEGTAYTTYAEHTELFVEVPTLVRDQAVSLAAHVTRLSDFGAVAAGRVIVVLDGGAQPSERYEIDAPSIPGIFRPVVQPQHATRRTMRVRVITEDIDEFHVVGEFDVAKDAAEAEAREAETEEEVAGEIGFTKEQQWRIDFATTPALERPIRPSFEAYGTLRARPDGQALVAAPVAGRLVSPGDVGLPQIGEEVEQGQVVAEIVPRLPDTGDLAALEQTAEEARLKRNRATRHVERLEGLFSSGAVAEKKVIDAQHEADQATAKYTMAMRRMAQVRRLQSSDGGLSDEAVSVPSPVAGSIVEMKVVPGGFVEEGRELCHVVDLDELWLEVHVTETHAKYLEEPKGVWFAVPGFDDVYERSAEHVVAVGGVVNARTRTIPLFVAVDNENRRLRVGMFADVHVLTDEARPGLAVPATAVLYESGLPVVYVLVGGETFVRRQVRLGARDGAHVEVLEGVTEGERVVSVGAYAVRLAAAKVTVPEHGHHH